MEGGSLWSIADRGQIRFVTVYFPAMIFALILAYLIIKRRFKK
jgi:hypothetical protein